VFRPDESARITVENWATASLDTWQSAFWSLYGPVDRSFPLYDMMLQLVGDATSLAEAVRKREYAEALPLMPRIFSWLSNMVAKVAVQNDRYHDLGDGKSLSDIVWNKYPCICYTCGFERCDCILYDVDQEKDARGESEYERELAREERKQRQRHVVAEAQQNHTKPVALDDWAIMFEKIYGGVNRTRTSAEKTFHFLEEVGEVEKELRAADRMKAGAMPRHPLEWEDEIADVFSWLMAVFLHVRGHLDRANVFIGDYQRGLRIPPDRCAGQVPLPRFSEVVWAQFGDETVGLRCHRCHKTRCDMTITTDPGSIDNRQLPQEKYLIPRRR